MINQMFLEQTENTHTKQQQQQQKQNRKKITWFSKRIGGKWRL